MDVREEIAGPLSLKVKHLKTIHLHNPRIGRNSLLFWRCNDPIYLLRFSPVEL